MLPREVKRIVLLSMINERDYLLMYCLKLNTLMIQLQVIINVFRFFSRKSCVVKNNSHCIKIVNLFRLIIDFKENRYGVKNRLFVKEIKFTLLAFIQDIHYVYLIHSEYITLSINNFIKNLF